MQPTDFHIPAATENPMIASDNFDQLPTTTPTLEFPVVTETLREEKLHAGAILLLIVGACIGGVGVYHLSRPIGPHSLYLLGPVFCIAYILITRFFPAKTSMRTEFWAIVSTMLLAGIIYVVGNIVNLFSIVMFPLLLPLVLREAVLFRRHYIYRATAGMLDVQTIQAFRQRHQLPPGLRPKSTFAGFSDAVVSYLTYNSIDQRVPGIFKSPSGGYQSRVARVCLLSFCLAYACAAPVFPEAIFGATPVRLTSTFVPMVVPIILWFAVLFFATFTFAGKAYALKSKQTASAHWPRLINRIQDSPDTTERESVFLGFVDYDRSPILYPLTSFLRHAWIVGKTGSGKTAYLLGLLDQFIQRGDVSVIFLDLKATTFEVLASMRDSTARLLQRTGRSVPIEHFTLDDGNSSYLFSIFKQAWWQQLPAPQRAACVLCALSLVYSRAYGQSYYTDSAYKLVYYVLRRWPDIQSWTQLRTRMQEAIRYAKDYELSPEVKRDGEHALLIVDRLADLTALNSDGHPQSVIDNAIDFADALVSPRHYYFATGAIRHPLIAGDVARQVAGAVLHAAATNPHASTRIILVIDEFQEMVTSHLALLLTQARSLGIGVILSNQTSSQLLTPDCDLRPIVEGNTSMQAWIQITDTNGREQIERLGGKQIITLQSRTRTSSSNGRSSSTTETEHIVERVSGPLISRIGSDASRFFLRLTDNTGYACYGDLVFVARSLFHQTKAAYETCLQASWPAQTASTLVSTANQTAPKPPQRPAPQQRQSQAPTSYSDSRGRTRKLGTKRQSSP